MLEISHLVGLDLGQVNDFTALVSLRREQEIPDPPKAKGFDPNAPLDWDAITNPDKPHLKPKQPARYICDIAERFERGIAYTALADNLVKLFQQPQFAGQTLVVDGTGVGRGVVDIFRKAFAEAWMTCQLCEGHGSVPHALGYVICKNCKNGKVKVACRLVPVTITGGAATLGGTTVDDQGYWHVPKKELVSSVQVLLGTDRLRTQPHRSKGREHASYANILMSELKNFTYKVNKDSGHVSFEAWREQEHDDLVLSLALAAWYGERAQKDFWIR